MKKKQLFFPLLAHEKVVPTDGPIGIHGTVV